MQAAEFASANLRPAAGQPAGAEERSMHLPEGRGRRSCAASPLQPALPARQRAACLSDLQRRSAAAAPTAKRTAAPLAIRAARMYITIQTLRGLWTNLALHNTLAKYIATQSANVMLSISDKQQRLALSPSRQHRRPSWGGLPPGGCRSHQQ